MRRSIALPCPVNVLAHNRRTWDLEVAKGNRWTIPVSPETIAAARRGEWEVLLTPTRPVPRAWFPPLAGCDLLGLASGGGQQGPVLAAAGARVTVLDNSPRQLGQDRMVADRGGLSITTVEIGGQLEAGFVLTGLFEDAWDEEPLSAYFPLCIATRAVKP